MSKLTQAPLAAPKPKVPPLSLLFMVLVGIIVAAYLLMAASPRDDQPNDFAYKAFAQIPVQENGRIKPIEPWRVSA
jgi:hypothetical protein